MIDTNVLLDLYSIHNLGHDYLTARADAGDRAEETSQVLYRRIRSADALALAIALHETRATTFALASEALRMMEAEVPPDEATDHLAFTLLFLHYVRDYCLDNWTALGDKLLGAAVSGNACDDLLVEVARRNALPLISVEGLGPEGINEKKRLRKRARAAGVEVLTPVEYVARLGVEFPVASKAFARRFHDRQDEYFASFAEDKRAAIREDIGHIGNVYQWCSLATKARPTWPAPPVSS